MIPNESGIYRLYCPLNGREYIGSAVNLYQRMHHHIHHLVNNKHSNGKLQNHFNKYWKNSLEFEVLKLCRKDELIEWEQKCIDGRDPFFNICRIAGNTLGRLHTEETKKHLSETRKGKYPEHLKDTHTTPEARKKISGKARQRGIPKACVDAAIKANTGRKASAHEIRKRIEKQTKISPEDAADIKYQLTKGARQIDLAKKYGVCQRTISRVKQSLGIFGDEDYYKAACERFDKETRQEALF